MVKNGHLTLPRGAVAIALLFGAGAGFAVSLPAMSVPAQAAKVGVAAAVNPDAFSSLSQVPNKQLNIGKSIFYNERIETTAQGLVQVLLVDGSTFTVGPNSNLVIDKFVYDPNKKTGQMVATFSKGSMRFIGGKLSKNAGGVKVNTPDGALAIRGGMFQGNTQRRIYSFLFGHSMTMQGRNGQTQTVYQPGYTLDLSSGRGNVRPTTAEDTNVFMQALSSPNSNTASAGGGNTGGSQNPNSTAQQTGQQADNISNAASQAIGDATFTQIQTEITKQLVRLEQLKSDPVAPPPVLPLPDNSGPETPTVVKTGGEFAGFATGLLRVGEDEQGTPLLVRGLSTVTLDPKSNSVTAKIDGIGYRKDIYRSGGPLGLPYRSYRGDTEFGLGFFGSGNNAYTDDNVFQALGDDATTTVVRNETFTNWTKSGPWYWPTWTKHQHSARTDYDNVTNDGAFGTLSSSILCEDCEFIKFGNWSSNVTFGQTTDTMSGWWIAGKVVPEANIDKLQQLQATASYEGNAIGTVTRLKNGAWSDYTATGDMTLDWQFAKRSGDFAVRDFDNRNFGGKLINAPGTSGFTGIVGHVNKNSLGRSIAGVANGSFVGFQGIDKTPKGVIGNFDVRQVNDRWRANGIYAGTQRVPH